MLSVIFLMGGSRTYLRSQVVLCMLSRVKGSVRRLKELFLIFCKVNFDPFDPFVSLEVLAKL